MGLTLGFAIILTLDRFAGVLAAVGVKIGIVPCTVPNCTLYNVVLRPVKSLVTSGGGKEKGRRSPARSARHFESEMFDLDQAGHWPGTGCKLIELESHPLESGEVEIREWVVVFAIKSEVTTVLITAPGKENRHIAVVVA